ncbi:MAG TPA: 3-oxoacyl-ACP reductase family protein [Actinomycetota bacterium]|nr:3-oxoacyl-ACP reductase family protein [Actinomycetota bacterium]
MTLAGRVTLVTGAGRGIGRACVEALSAEGAKVAVGFLGDEDSAAELAASCKDGIAVRIDVEDQEEVDRAFGEVEERLGSVEILVNNAGITRDRLLLRMKEAEWEEVISTDLTGVFRCTKRALPGMLKGGWGRVVTIGSVVGSAGNAGQTNYAAAKAGVVGFSKSLAREVANHGITVNVVAPGLVDTDLTAALSPAARQALLDRIPLRRAGEPEEIAEAVRFCVRASYLTGQVIGIDGGLT